MVPTFGNTFTDIDLQYIDSIIDDLFDLSLDQHDKNMFDHLVLLRDFMPKANDYAILVSADCIEQIEYRGQTVNACNIASHHDIKDYRLKQLSHVNKVDDAGWFCMSVPDMIKINGRTPQQFMSIINIIGACIYEHRIE